MIVRVAETTAPFNDAPIVEVIFEVTDVVFTVKVADVLPAGIVTEAGAVAVLLLLPNVIINPPVGAGLVIVTVPVLDFPPTTDAGLSVTDLRDGAETVSTVDFMTPLSAAVSVTAV